MAKNFQMPITAIMERNNMTANMVVIGVYGKIRKNVGPHENRIEKTATVQMIWPNQIFLCILMSLWDPLGCSKLAEIFVAAYSILNKT